MNKIITILRSVNQFGGKQRSFIRGSLFEYGVVTMLYLGYIALLTKSVLFNLGSQIYSNIGDATAGFMWLNYADPGLNPIITHTDDVNYPLGESIGGASFITYTALWLPIRLFSTLFGPIAGLNIVMIFGFLFTALAAYWFVKRITGNVFAAFFAGFAGAFVPYAVYKSSGHIAYIFGGVFVLIIAAFMAVWLRPTLRRALLFAAVVALAFYVDGYYILLATVLVAGLTLGGGVFGLLSRYVKKDYVSRLKMLGIATAAFLVLVTPIVVIQLTQGGNVQSSLASLRPQPIEGEIRAYRTNVLDFLVPPLDSPIYGETDMLRAVHDYKNLRSNGGESMNYIAKVVLFLCAFGLTVLGIAVFFKKKSSLDIDPQMLKKILLVACIGGTTLPLFIAFMFSPEVYVAGFKFMLPGQFFIEHDINLWRVLSRFFVPLNIVIVLFSGLSLYLLYVCIAASPRVRQRFAAAVAIFLTIICAAEYFVDIPSRPFSFATQTPETYKWLAHQSDIKTIAELPLVNPLDKMTSRYVTYQIVHGKKSINMRDPNAEGLNNAIGDDTSPETLNYLRKRGVEVVLLRDDSCTQKPWGELIHTSIAKDIDQPDLKLCAYKLTADSRADDAFLVYRKGIEKQVNKTDRPADEILITEKRAILQPTTNLFKKLPAGTYNFSATISNEAGVRWRVVQNSKQLVAGSSDGAVKVMVAGDQPIEIRIDSSQEVTPAYLELTDIVLTKI